GNNKTIYADYDLKWDNANRITDFDFKYLNGPEKRSESKYRYDKTSQLINASYNFMQHEKYDFDLNGNRKQAEIQGQKQSYKTGEYNRLLSDENYSYEYDLEGNRISKTDKEGKTTKYTWDNRNRLVKVSTPTNEIEYLYDYLNRLVKRIENKTEQQYFIHDNWQIILQFDNKELKPTHRYLWGIKQDELICDNENWILCDHLNSIRDIVKSDGTVADHLEYNSFGKLISVTKNTDSTFFAYTGKLIDKSNYLQWNINRWYDSNVGRWMSEDPIGFEGNDINLYRHVDNSVVLYTDWFGLWKIRRDSSKRIVDVYAEQDDKFEELATKIGLNISQKNSWLTLYNNEQPGAKPKCGNKYGIPNTIYSAWFGDDIPNMYSDWKKKNGQLVELGFYVATYDNDLQGTGSTMYLRENMKKMFIGSTYAKNALQKFLNTAQNIASQKQIHRLVIDGHGSPTSFGTTIFYQDIANGKKDSSAVKVPQVRPTYQELRNRMKYKLGAVVILACMGNGLLQNNEYTPGEAKALFTDDLNIINNKEFTPPPNVVWHGWHYVANTDEVRALNIKSLWSGGKQATTNF
ncbi:MAG: hypothetical protein LBC74_12115, partial [Planctomycetaceae bacterium]|nr:hypothetical protein [Planctomycetaceae bacterium]